MQEEVYIYLKFVETNLIPEEITNLIKVNPTICGKKGDLVRGRKLPIDEGWWFYKSILVPPWNVGEALEKLLPLIEPNEKLRKYCKDFNIYIEFSVIMYLAENAPIVTLEPPLLQRIANIGATIDFDIYFIDKSDL